MRTTKKVGLTGAVVIALLLAMATPAAAGGPYPIEVTGGTLETVIGDFDLTPGSQGTPPCSPGTSTVALSTDNDANPPGVGNFSVNGSYKSQFQQPAGSGHWYQADFTIIVIGVYTANPTPPPDYILVGTIIVVGVTITDIGQVGAPGFPNCSKNPVICNIGAVNIPFTGEFHGSLPNPATGDYAVIDATIPSLVASPCNPPFSALNGTPANIVGMKLEVQ